MKIPNGRCGVSQYVYANLGFVAGQVEAGTGPRRVNVEPDGFYGRLVVCDDDHEVWNATVGMIPTIISPGEVPE